MMPVLGELRNYLLANSTRFKTGGSTGSKIPIWLSKLPSDQADTCIGLFESGGPNALYIHTGVLAVERPTIQVICRSTSYVTARNTAEHVYRKLSGITNQSITKDGSTAITTYLTVSPVQSPTDMGQDAEERALITTNYLAEKGLS